MTTESRAKEWEEAEEAGIRYRITVVAPVNIALIKYWGKSDEQRVIPANASISLTLATDALHTRTRILLCDLAARHCDCKENVFLRINGHSCVLSHRQLRCIQQMREIAKKTHASDDRWKMHVFIDSTNSFPTAAGLASSASGLAAIVFGLWQVFGLQNAVSLEELSRIARIGSGSACRSLFGGFVCWDVDTNSNDSFAYPLLTADSPLAKSISVLIFVFEDAKKKVSSSEGMRRTAQTSQLYAHRVSRLAPDRISRMKHAIERQDCDDIFKLTMQDSNSFHALCLDTFPPLFYLNEQSKKLIEAVNAFNETSEQTNAAYSFDAGPNGFVFVKAHCLMPFVRFLIENGYLKDCSLFDSSLAAVLVDVPSKEDAKCALKVKSVLQTFIGSGPYIEHDA